MLLLNVSSSIASPFGSCFARDIGFIGYPLKDGIRKNNNHGQTTSAENCQFLCQVTLGCEWFNWESKTQVCWLMEHKGRMIEKKGTTTGPVYCDMYSFDEEAFCMVNHIVYNGTPLKRVKWNGTQEWTNNHGWTETARDCQVMCSFTLGCQWFSWDGSSNCLLFSGMEEENIVTEEFGSMTGPATCWNTWNYDNPEMWHEDYPSCGGKRQSPINLQDAVFQYKLEESMNFTGYHEINMENTIISNNGHTIILKIDEEGETKALLEGEGNLFNGSYKLLQAHFHWGINDFVGSEHTLDGKRFPLEMHLLHEKVEFENHGFLKEGIPPFLWENDENVTEVVLKKEGEDCGYCYCPPDYWAGTCEEGLFCKRDPNIADIAGTCTVEGMNEEYTEKDLLITAFLFEISEDDNPAMAPIVDKLQKLRRANTSIAIDDVNFSIASIIEPVLSGPFYSYPGSLTSPGCHPANWIVFKETLKISSEQIHLFRSLFDYRGAPMLNNFRPIQELDERTVFYSAGGPQPRNVVSREDQSGTPRDSINFATDII